MLDYAGAVDVSVEAASAAPARASDHRRRSWRDDMSAADVAGFEAVAGDLLRELGYDVTRRDGPAARPALTRGGTTPVSPRGTPPRRCSSARRYGRGVTRDSQPEGFGASRPGVAMRRPFSERKYVRSVAIPGVYLPSRIRHAIDPVLDAQRERALVERREEDVRTDHDGRAEEPAADVVLQSSSPLVARKARMRPSNPPANTRPSATAGVV